MKNKQELVNRIIDFYIIEHNLKEKEVRALISLKEEYHKHEMEALRIHDVVRQSKHFCLCEEPDENWDSGQVCFCGKCDKLVDAC